MNHPNTHLLHETSLRSSITGLELRKVLTRLLHIREAHSFFMEPTLMVARTDIDPKMAKSLFS